jgi:SAM-dependent methyltransferase
MCNPKQFLKRSPAVYKMVQSVYYHLRKTLEIYILGTKMNELLWKFKHYFNQKRWGEEYSGSHHYSHRRLLRGKIANHAPLVSVLEIGCNIGSNLAFLAEAFPQARLYGVDINAGAIKEGIKLLKKMGAGNIDLFVGKADQLKMFGEKSVDVSFTDATLLYIGPDKIHKVIAEMLRVTRKVLVFNEWHWIDNSSSHESFWYDAHWVHDYRLLLSGYFSFDRITITKIPKDVWNGGGWGKYGAIIEAKL